MTENEHARLLKEYLGLVCEDDPEVRRVSYSEWFLRRAGAPLAVGAMLALAGCSSSDTEGDANLTPGGGESSLGGDANGTAGQGEGGATERGGSTGSGGVAGKGQGGTTERGGATGFGGAAGKGQGGAQGLGGAVGKGGAASGGASSVGGAGGVGYGGDESQGGTAGEGQAGAAAGGTAVGGSAGTGQGGHEENGGSAGTGIGGGEAGAGFGGGYGGVGTLYGIPFENCGNGLDDDYDDAVDCDDDDCIGKMACGADYAVPIEVCDDGRDNDYDDAVDCDDDDCIGKMACGAEYAVPIEVCDDGRDNDYDDAIDCDDTDCARASNCEGEIYATLAPELSDGCPAMMERTLTLHNDGGSEVFLPGCANYFIDNGSAGTRAPDVVCSIEGIARVVPPGGTFEATYVCPDEGGTIRLCFQVSSGCTPDQPISKADCSGQQWICAPEFSLIPLP